MRIDQYSVEQSARNRTYQEQQSTIVHERPVIVFENVLEEANDDFEKAKKMELIDTLIAILSKEPIPVHEQYPDIPEVGTTTKTIVTEQTVYYEHATMTYDAAGYVQTEDGREIQFHYQLHFDESHIQAMRTSRRVSVDPLVICLDPSNFDLSDQKIEIDLDLDGCVDTISKIQSGSGFLVLDLNNNNQVDDGSELFGPKTDNGFAELKAYDLDKNGWIDENDQIFNQLKVWLVDDQGEMKLIPLKETSVGAIYTGAVDSYFDLNGQNRNGHIARTGMFLRNNGMAGAVHEIKL